jgi:fumarate reductase subunit D
MKTVLLKIYGSLLLPVILFFAPIYVMVFLVGLSTIVDTCFGIWKAKQLGEEVTSKACRHGLVPKIRSYVLIVLILFTADHYIVNELTKLFIDVEFVSTKLVSLGLIVIEVKSMDESFEKVKGYSFIGKLFSNLRNIKKVKDEFKP